MLKIQIMGLFNKLFSSSSEQKEDNIISWIDLNDASQLKTINNTSATKTQVIFKHSTQCGISRMVKNQFVKDYEFNHSEIDLYYLDLIAHREISNAVANTFNIVHESPQLLVIKNGIVIMNASHGAINDVDLKRFI